MKTINDLALFLKSNCYNLENYSLLGEFITEGCGIEINNGIYIWYYTENGMRENIKYFYSEEDIVSYSYRIIFNDKYAKSSLFIKLYDYEILKYVKSELEKLNIIFWIEEINQIGIYDKLFRIFVEGCDIKKVKYENGKIVMQ